MLSAVRSSMQSRALTADGRANNIPVKRAAMSGASIYFTLFSFNLSKNFRTFADASAKTPGRMIRAVLNLPWTRWGREAFQTLAHTCARVHTTGKYRYFFADTLIFKAVFYMHRVATLLLMLLLTVVTADAVRAQSTTSQRKVVVIDAGHGGLFPGATYGGVAEKTLTLQVAQRLGKMIEERLDDVDVVYTRTSDVDLADKNAKYANNKARLKADLQRRTDIANGKVGKNARCGDLLISIHANAAAATAANGTETIIMGESSYEVETNEKVLRESTIDEFVDMNDKDAAAAVRAYVQNLQYTYGKYSYALARIIQRNYTAIGRRSHEHKGDYGVKKQMIKVLYGVEMPCVLTELGFMSNSAELAYLRSEKGQKALAGALCKAVEEYFAFMRGELDIDSGAAAGIVPTDDEDDAGDDTPAVAEESAKTAKSAEKSKSSGSGYTVQILASAKKIAAGARDFKGRKDVKMYSDKGKFPYRYCIGEYATEREAHAAAAKLRQTFKGAFVVRYSGNEIVK